jgi:hypothetical protein
MAPYLIGQCCLDQIITPDPVNPDASGKNEPIPFENVATLTLPWNATRINRFGTHASLQVYMVGGDGVLRETTCEIKPDNLIAPTSYFFDFGGVSTGVIIIT